MKRNHYIFLLITLIFVGVLSVAPTYAKTTYFKAPLWGPTADPSEPAYCKGCGGQVEVYESFGDVYAEIYFKYNVTPPDYIYEISMQCSYCVDGYCAPLPLDPPLGPPQFINESFLIDEVGTDSKGEFLGTYNLRDFVPPNFVTLEAVTFRVEPAFIQPGGYPSNDPFVLFTGFKLSPQTTP